MVPSGEKFTWSTATSLWLRFLDNQHFAHTVETSSGEREERGREEGMGGRRGWEKKGKKEEVAVWGDCQYGEFIFWK